MTVRHVFPNGFTVLVREDHATPVVALVTRVKAGYFDEPDTHVGIAHVLEHMYFKGTPTRGPGEIANATKAAGGWLNAHTIYDATTYITVVPAGTWQDALDIQFDAWANSSIDADELRRELEVIIQEAARKADTPSAVTTETLFELLHDTHRMRRWRIGREAQLRGFTREMVHGFYRNWYTPSNSILAVTGAVDAEAVIAAVGTRYGAGPARDPMPDEGPREAHWRAPRVRHLTGDVTRSHLAMGWRTVGPLHPDCAALDVAAAILGTGRASRLHRAVRETGLATSASAWHYTPTQLGVFVLSATGSDETVSQLVTSMHAQLRQLADGGTTKAELARAITQLTAQRLRGQESAEGWASELVSWEALGGQDVGEAYWEAVTRVTAADVSRVLAEWCPVDGAALVTFRPTGAAPLVADDSALPALLGGAVSAGTPVSPGAGAPVDLASPTSADAAHHVTWEQTEGEVHVFRTHGGVPVLAQRRAGAALVHLGCHVAGGASAESAAEYGWTSLLARTMVKDVATVPAGSFAELVESIGGSLHASVSKELVGWSVSVPAAHGAQAATLLSQVVLHPRLDPADLDTERRHLLTELRARADDMVRHPIAMARAQFFAGHPYAVDAGGTIESLQAATPEAIRRWHAEQVLGGRLVLSVVGDAPPDQLAALVGAPFASLAAATASGAAGDVPSSPAPVRSAAAPSGPTHSTSTRSAPALPIPTLPTEPRELVEDRVKQQSAIALILPGPARASEDRAALSLLTGVASGLGGRFFESLRSRQSLAYSVSVSASSLQQAGMVLAYIACAPERELEARAGLAREFALLREGAVTAEELERARRYAIGMEALRQESSAARLGDMVEAYLLGRGLDELTAWTPALERVTLADLQRVAQRWCMLERGVTAVVRGTARGA